MTPPASFAPLRPRGSNHVGMRQFNERVVLQAIRLNGSMPKADLARLTGLTAQTIGLITARLEEDGLLMRHEPVRGRIGQPSVPLALHPDGAFAIGIKIGRRRTEWLLVDLTGQVRQRHVLEYPFPDAATLLPALGERLLALRDSLGPLATRLLGVGLAAPFQLGGWHRMLGLSQAQSDDWNHIDLRAHVAGLTDLPVSLAKDTSAACVAELVAGRGRDLKSFLYLFVDTFVGGGLVLNSEPHAGAHGNAGAVASLPLAPPALDGSLPGQLISRASLWDLEQRFSAHGLDPMAAYDERALLPPFAAETGIWLDSAAAALAHCITSGMAFLDLDAVVVDGALCRSLLDRLITQTRSALAQCNWEGLWQPVLHTGAVGTEAGALGGALLPLYANFATERDVFLKVSG